MGFHAREKGCPFVVGLGNLAQINDEECMVALVVFQIVVDDVVGLVIAAVKLDVVFLEKSVAEPLVSCAAAGVFCWVHIIQLGAKILYSLPESVITPFYILNADPCGRRI